MPFGTVHKLPSGRYRALYYRDGQRHKAPTTFATKTEARKFLATVQADIIRNAMDPERRELSQRVEEAERKAAAIVAAAIDDSFDPAGCFVCILWGDDPETPVYIGKSTNVMGRIGDHMCDKRDLIRRVQLIRCLDAAVMEETELRLIRRYRPQLDIVGMLP